MLRAGADQLVPAAIAVEHTDPRHAVIPGADHVVAAIADHHGSGRIDGRDLQRVLQQIGFIDAGAIEFGAEHLCEMMP